MEGHITTNHNMIQQWIEARGGHPARVKRTGYKNDPGALRVDFPGYSSGESLEPMSWDAFFEQFEETRLALLYQDRTNLGSLSHFCKFISRY